MDANTFRPLDGLARPVVVALGVTIGLSLVVAGHAIVDASVLGRELAAPGSVSEDRLDLSATLSEILAWTWVAGWVCTAALWLRWMHRATQNLELWTVPRQSPGWAVGSWFVPIVNLFVPKRATNDIWRASEPQAPCPWWFNLWWALWLIGFVVSRAGMRGLEEGSLGDLQGHDHVDIFVGFTDAAAAALAIAVVISITRRQREHAANRPARPRIGPLVPAGPHTYSVEPAWERVEVDPSAPAQLPTGYVPSTTVEDEPPPPPPTPERPGAAWAPPAGDGPESPTSAWAAPAPESPGAAWSGDQRERFPLRWISLRAEARNATIALVVCLLWVPFALWNTIVGLQWLDDVERDDYHLEQLTTDLESSTYWGGMVILLLGAIFFGRWLHACLTNVRAFGVDPDPSPGWAVGSFFVPIVNLYVPLQAMRLLWREGHPSSRPPALLVVWWASWLAALATTVVGIYIVPEERYDEELWRASYLIDFARLPLVLVAGVSALVLVRRITARLEARSRAEGLERV